jgi:tetrapyrrole methylase family protein/MazG family protein
MEQTEKSFARFFDILKRLRAPDGCSWDIDQTPLSMRDSLIEEAFEAAEAISQEDAPHVKEELGDVLLNAFIIAYMHEQAQSFTVARMLDELSDKLIRRHPHVFKAADTDAALNPGQVLEQWDDIKANVEKRAGGSILDQVSAGLPPLLKAFKLQKKAAKKNFDWQNAEEVEAKVREEFGEARQALAAVRRFGGNSPEPFTSGASAAFNQAQLLLEEEIGDLLFSVVNWARHIHVDPTIALSRANQKFSRRFRAVERAVESQGKKMTELSAAELDAYWRDAKADNPNL